VVENSDFIKDKANFACLSFEAGTCLRPGLPHKDVPYTVSFYEQIKHSRTPRGLNVHINMSSYVDAHR